jgi:heme-degrading monooxygenase HmoA
MYTRVVDCRIKLEHKEEFRKAIAEQVLPTVKNQPGFVELFGMLSDESSDHALVVSIWNSKEDAENYYRKSSPMVAVLEQYLKTPGTVEHFYVDTATLTKVRTGKAA